MKSKNIIICDVINYILDITCLGLILFFCFHYGFETNKAINITLYILMGFALMNVFMVMIRLLVDKEYEFKKKEIILFSSILVSAVFCHYLFDFVNLKPFIYWLILIDLNLFVIIGILIFYKIKENKTKEA